MGQLRYQKNKVAREVEREYRSILRTREETFSNRVGHDHDNLHHIGSGKNFVPGGILQPVPRKSPTVTGLMGWNTHSQ